METESGRSFDSLTYLAVNYFYDQIYLSCKEEDDKIKKYHYRKLKSTSIAGIKAILDVCNYTPYTPMEIITNTEYVELFRADYFTECYLIIQTAYFFGSKRFGEHPYFESVEHYRKTGEILQNGVDEQRLESAFKKIDDFKEWVKSPTKFKKRPVQFNMDTYLNSWYYGVLDILANTFGTCKNYKYDYKVKNGVISDYRLYNKFIQTPRILRKVQPFEMIEFDVMSGHLSYIDLIVGSNVSKSAYENYAKKYNVSRDVAKRKFNSILNLKDRRNTWNSKQKYIETLCGFGWTKEEAIKIQLEITDSPNYLFVHWASKHESKYVQKLAEVNNIVGWTRGHDSLNFLKRNDIDYNNFCTSFENGIIQFELTEIVNEKNYSVQQKIEKEKSTDIVDPSLLSTKLGEIKNEVEKFKRIEGEVLNGFLSDKIEELKEYWSWRHINILISPPSSGKTSMVEKLNEQNYRCLLIVPTKAIIKNKNLNGFVKVFDSIDIQKHINNTESIICTFDKGAQIKVEDFGKFDYVIIDESHLLFTERYRINAIVLLLKKLNSYMRKVRSNTNLLINSTIIILMTGTPTGEEFYFGTDEHGEPITQKKEFINNKNREVTLVGCENRDMCYTSIISKTKELLKSKFRVLIPTNMGEKWINCFAGNIGSPNFAIYSNNQKYNQVSEDINKISMINDDVEILFTTSLGNVGIDINNTDKPIVMVVYTDNQNSITAQEIEQYANRFRRTNVKIFVFFVIPKNNQYDEEFAFNYVEDPNEISLIKNHIATDLFTDNEFENMEDSYGVDKDKVKWKVLNEKLKEHYSNIICIGGNLKKFGYNVKVIEGTCTDSFVIKKYQELLKEQNELEKQSKVRALDFILSDVFNLIRKFSVATIKLGNYSLVEEILTLENEQIFRNVRLLVKKCVDISGFINDYGWIKSLMEDCNMNFKEIDNRLKFMKFVNSDLVDDLDNSLIDEVDKIVNMIDGYGSLSKLQYQKMLDDLSPKYINKAYNNMDRNTKLKLQENFKKKLNVCYIIKQGKKIEFKQRYTQAWISDTITWYEDNLKGKLETEAPMNKRLLRNRKGKAIGENIGNAYTHISDDTITDIAKRVEIYGFVTVKEIMEITGLSNKSVGGFVKAKFSELKSTPKMIKGVRETRYS
ncbi:DEAD/DEAH box helicase family protein [Flavobacterium sp. WG21]|uniref:DEAD/DEAH box helicase family protein n=1 Tax=Flavobacterium sp. WG21 TaxID=1229487 RepID=UPI0012F7E6A0|nr:DEAD/DEAH box helicase family protein [Flavobacterium sp. WG21]